MPNYTTIEEILKMLYSGCTYAEIRNRFKIGSSVITDIKKKFEKMNMSIEDLESLPAEEIKNKFYPNASRKQDIPLPDFKRVYLVTTDKQSRALFLNSGMSTRKSILMDISTRNSKNIMQIGERNIILIDEDYKMSTNKKPG